MTKAFEKIKAGLEETLAMLRAERPVLPDGVHYLSDESYDIMRRIAERSAALEAGFTKRAS